MSEGKDIGVHSMLQRKSCQTEARGDFFRRVMEVAGRCVKRAQRYSTSPVRYSACMGARSGSMRVARELIVVLW